MARLGFVASALFIAQALAATAFTMNQTPKIVHVNEMAGTGNTEIIVIEVRNGGTSAVQTMNPPMMTPGQTHQVTVGGAAGMVYTPSTIMAKVGDLIEFIFLSVNHTVTQSTFSQPCVSMPGGMDSGFMPNPSNSMSPPPMIKLQVMTSSPLWMYSRQMGECSKGMVFSVNPTSSQSQSMFEAAAMATASEMIGSSSSMMVSSSPLVVAGSGTIVQDACSCSCLCAVEVFAPGSGLGVGMVGGMGGMIPIQSMSSMTTMTTMEMSTMTTMTTMEMSTMTTMAMNTMTTATAMTMTAKNTMTTHSLKMEGY